MALADELVWSGHRQCETCGRMTGGPLQEREDVAPQRFKTDYIDETGRPYTHEERKAGGLPVNVSHGKCRNCLEQWTREARMGSEGRKQMRERRERDEFDETTARVEQSYQQTLDRVEQSFNESVHRRDEPQTPPDEAETDSPE